jgi:AcrR family transcriptional regulator
VLTKAIPVFWKRGFADTKVEDLEEATGVNKSGLYSEFSSKEEIFVESLKHAPRRVTVFEIDLPQMYMLLYQ